MSVEMGIRHRDTGAYEVVPVATAQTFGQVWLPACERLGLKLVPLFANGALTRVPPELIPQILAELEHLRAVATELTDGGYLADQCSGILAAFARTDPALFEYDFG
jgi:hypothetical protein